MNGTLIPPNTNSVNLVQTRKRAYKARLRIVECRLAGHGDPALQCVLEKFRWCTKSSNQVINGMNAVLRGTETTPYNGW